MFAAEHGLKIGTIADLIRYRLANEPTVERVADTQFNTEFGPFRLVTYQDLLERQLHFALVRGQVDANHPTLVGACAQHLKRCASGAIAGRRLAVAQMLRRIAEAGNGVAVILGPEEDSSHLVRRLRAHISSSWYHRVTDGN